MYTIHEHLEYMYINNVSMVTSVAVYIKFYNLSTTSCVHFVIPHHHSAQLHINSRHLYLVSVGAMFDI